MKLCDNKLCKSALGCKADCKSLISKICGNRDLIFPKSNCGSIYFVGIEDVTIKKGDAIDLISGVHAYDANGNEIPFTVTPRTLDTTQVGVYAVTYTARGVSSSKMVNACGKNRLHIIYCEEETVSAIRTVTVVPDCALTCEAKICESVVCC